MKTLNIPVQANTISGSNVRVGQFIRNTKSVKKQVMVVVGGSELSKFGIARLLTNLPSSLGGQGTTRNYHQTLFAWCPEPGSDVDTPGYCYPINLDGNYELIASFDQFSTNG